MEDDEFFLNSIKFIKGVFKSIFELLHIYFSFNLVFVLGFMFFWKYSNIEPKVEVNKNCFLLVEVKC